MKRIAICFSFLIFSISVNSQTLTQTVRGTITDKLSKVPLPGANVVLQDSALFMGTASDMDGKFKLEEIPVGRRTFKITFMGYREKTVQAVVTSGKEIVLNIELEESVIMGQEVVIVATNDKNQTNNKMTTVSSRSFSIEETSKYAGSRNDPSRMAANYAGVSGANDARNDIVIRGNSPQGILWRLNGVDIPNPNHFGSLGTTGGPVSILNNNVLDQSDFLTGAFPADYGNVIAGVFDLKMRSGNNEKREYLGQIGFNGFELGAEGPFKKGKDASYLVNYRYSTLGVFQALGMNFGTGAAVPQYQDMSFKMDFPTKKAGRFSVFGLGGLSYIELLDSKKDSTQLDLYSRGNEDVYYASNMGVVGITHLYMFPKNMYTKLSVALSGISVPAKVNRVERDSLNNLHISPFYNSDSKQGKISANFSLNKKYNSKNNLVTGIIGDSYSVYYKDSILENNTFTTLRDYSGETFFVQAYTNWQHKFTDLLSLNTGAHYQLFTLNSSYSIEPRLGLKWEFTEKQSISLGSGFHSQMQPLYIYFAGTTLPDGSYLNTNTNLGFTRSKHLVIAYDNNFTKNFRLKAETYYQLVSDAPVSDRYKQFSMLNSGADFDNPNIDSLVNKGSGENYGIELTLEKFYDKSYYFLLTGSLFESKYKGTDEVLRNTAFNGNFVTNALGGKEFKIKDNMVLAVDVKFTYAGGKRYIPIDLEASKVAGRAVYDYGNAYQSRYKDYFRSDLKVTFRANGKRATQEWVIDIQNISDHKNLFQQIYDPSTDTLRTEHQMGIFFVPQYRILF